MFENLSDRLQGIFSGLRGKGRLTEDDINSAMREVRMAMLEADVNFKVVKQFVARTKERCLDAEVLDSLSPTQNVIKIVTDELTELLGRTDSKLVLSSRIPNVIMLVGLQGSGKTTAAAKLAYRLKAEGHSPLLAACDGYRPAAADQLETLGNEIGVRVFRGDGKDPVAIAEGGIKDAIANLRDVVIVDTAGRLHVDEQMMEEAQAIKRAVKPDQILMVVDAMTGQDVVNVAAAFAERVDFDGVIMSKMDGDARGGGDMLSLIESAVKVQQEEEEKAETERLMKSQLNLNDFITMNRQIRKMGGVSKLIAALPGGEKALGQGQVDEGALDRMEVIINSMTKAEREKPELLNGSRRARIAAGAGVHVSEVNQLMKKFNETKKMMKKMMPAVEDMGNKKGKKGKKGKRRRMGIPGMGGMSMSDLKKIQDMMGDVK